MFLKEAFCRVKSSKSVKEQTSGQISIKLLKIEGDDASENQESASDFMFKRQATILRKCILYVIYVIYFE